MQMHPDVNKILFTEDEIKAHVARLGAAIDRDFAGEDVVIVTVLRGAAIFSADLARAIKTVPVEMDYMAISSYGASTKSSGVVNIQKDLSSPITGRNVIVAEDILDSGLTLSYVLEILAAREPKSLTFMPLFIKKGVQKVHIDVDYPALEIPNEFVVGYGLDYAEKYRNLPYLAVLDPKVYSK